jgi:hypothetical protein
VANRRKSPFHSSHRFVGATAGTIPISSGERVVGSVDEGLFPDLLDAAAVDSTTVLGEMAWRDRYPSGFKPRR